MEAEEKEEEKKLPYPKSVFLIIVNEFCERFCYYGMRAVLSLYLRDQLLLTEKDATIVFHVFNMFAYFFPIFGAIIADSFLGKFRTILYVSMIYVCGNIFLALSSVGPLHLPSIEFCFSGLVLIAMGTGGIKPCVSAFGGDQFQLPEQAKQLATFFSIFYFSINLGSLSSTVITPILGKTVTCFNTNTCYPFAFSLPGMLMIIAIIIFVIGKPFYKILIPKKNVVLEVLKCIGYGIKKKIKSKEKVEHWLDRSEEKYGKKMVQDIKNTLRVLVLFIPIPMFWALFDQQGSGWTFQASRMDGTLGSYVIFPDQIQLLNSLFIVLLIPIFIHGIYPLLTKCHLLKTPLQRMTCGGFIAALSFVISAGISFAIEKRLPVLPAKGECQIRIYNLLDCRASITAQPYFYYKKIKSMGYTRINIDKIKGTKTVNYTIDGCDQIDYNNGINFKVKEKSTLLYCLFEDKLLQLEDDIKKNNNGFPKVRTLLNKPKKGFNLAYWNQNEKLLQILSNDTSISSIRPGVYKLNKFNKELKFKQGGVYTILVYLKNNTNNIENVVLHEITEPNSIHVLYQIPQYLVISIGEILLSVTGLEFSYSQAPITMKSVLAAAWLLCTSLGNLMVALIQAIEIFEKQSANFIMYGILMVVDMLLFTYLATRYKYVEEQEDHNVVTDDQAAAEQH